MASELAVPVYKLGFSVLATEKLTFDLQPTKTFTPYISPLKSMNDFYHAIDRKYWPYKKDGNTYVLLPPSDNIEWGNQNLVLVTFSSTMLITSFPRYTDSFKDMMFLFEKGMRMADTTNFGEFFSNLKRGTPSEKIELFVYFVNTHPGVCSKISFLDKLMKVPNPQKRNKRSFFRVLHDSQPHPTQHYLLAL